MTADIRKLAGNATAIEFASIQTSATPDKLSLPLLLLLLLLILPACLLINIFFGPFIQTLNALSPRASFLAPRHHTPCVLTCSQYTSQTPHHTVRTYRPAKLRRRIRMSPKRTRTVLEHILHLLLPSLLISLQFLIRQDLSVRR
jgi:hypothetical protein